MVSKEFTNFAKIILDLKNITGKSEASKKYENYIVDCAAVLQNFSVNEFKKIIKMFLFCVGTSRYDFGKVLYFKIDFQKIDIDLIEYIVNLVRFTGRKKQVKLMFTINNNIYHIISKLKINIDIVSYVSITDTISDIVSFYNKTGIDHYFLSDNIDLVFCKALLNSNQNIKISYINENMINDYLLNAYAIAMES